MHVALFELQTTLKKKAKICIKAESLAALIALSWSCRKETGCFLGQFGAAAPCASLSLPPLPSLK